MDRQIFPIARGSSAPLWFCGVIGVLTVALGAFLGFVLLFASRVVTFDVSDRGLRIRGDIYGRFIPRADLDPSRARQFDRAAEAQNAPTRRTNGIGLPDYQSGWFQLADGSKGLLFVTDWSRVVLVPTNQGYTLLASPADPRAFLGALQQPAAAAAAFPIAARSPVANPVSWIVVPISVVLPLSIGALLALIAYSTRAVRFEVSSEGLRIRGDLFGRLIPRSKLLLGEARIVDLKAEPEHRPVLRTWGVGLPGYGSGWFLLKNRSRALLFLTNPSRAVWLPTTDGYTLLISPADPEGLLAALER
jgi:hypothetical protein